MHNPTLLLDNASHFVGTFVEVTYAESIPPKPPTCLTVQNVSLKTLGWTIVVNKSCAVKLQYCQLGLQIELTLKFLLVLERIATGAKLLAFGV